MHGLRGGGALRLDAAHHPQIGELQILLQMQWQRLGRRQGAAVDEQPVNLIAPQPGILDRGENGLHRELPGTAGEIARKLSETKPGQSRLRLG